MSERKEAINAFIQKDPYANYLGATVEIVAEGHSRVSLTITEDMVNFHGATHGGIVFGVADIAFAAAGNSWGQTAVALNNTISFIRPSFAGDHLVAEAMVQEFNGPVGIFDITVTEMGRDELIAKLQTVLYRKRDWFVAE